MAMAGDEESVWRIIAEFTLQRRLFTDNAYVAGNILCQSVLGKKSIIIYDNEEYLHPSVEKFKCHIPGCMKFFETLIDFEDHYNTSHRYVCATCHKRLPSPHLLDLHVSETHDSYFAALAERQPMFQCFVESCALKCATKKERRSHCIEVHRFPPDFRFDPLRNGPKLKEIKVSQNKNSVFSKKLGFGNHFYRGSFPPVYGHHSGNRKINSQRHIGAEAKETEVSMIDLQEALSSME